jgi:hypothetical protein
LHTEISDLYSFLLRSCLATGPQPFSKRVLLREKPITYTFKVRYMTFSLRSSSSCLYQTFSLMRFLRRQRLRNMYYINLQFTLSVKCKQLNRTAVFRTTGSGFPAEAGVSLFARTSRPVLKPNHSLIQRVEKALPGIKLKIWRLRIPKLMSILP